jgi:hypothetical protein
MSTISVVIVAFYLDLSIDLSCAAVALKYSDLGESWGENLIAGLPQCSDDATWHRRPLQVVQLPSASILLHYTYDVLMYRERSTRDG